MNGFNLIFGEEIWSWVFEGGQVELMGCCQVKFCGLNKVDWVMLWCSIGIVVFWDFNFKVWIFVFWWVFVLFL